jgi:predicted short-subunit dehydrogenase-like oxidoreductase (DUF2520 family)
MKIAIVGTGRAGSSFARALRDAGHEVELHHHGEHDRFDDIDLILLCVPDDAIAVVANEIPPSSRYVLAHVAGSRTLDVLAGHSRVGSMHPLVAMPSGEVGARRLVGATYCVSGDDLVRHVVASLHGRAITLSDDQRTLYHATATVASNHVVALLGQVQRLAQRAGLSLEDFLSLSRQAIEDVAALGPEGALTGPASRGDVATIDAHLHALPDEERATYVALANAAFELAEKRSLRIA